MESARRAIESDNSFNLMHLPGLDGLLKMGITVSVEKIIKNYHDMTLIQYAIAKRKPKTLEVMLKRAKELKIPDRDIIYPKTSNTKASLLKLAIEFGSKDPNDPKSSVDNECLKVIIKYLGDTISKDNKYTETPLTMSIDYQNNEAIEILLKTGANFLSPLKEEETTINSYIVSEMPIMSLFRKHNDKDELESYLNATLKEKKEEILYPLYDLKDDQNNSFINYLDNYKLDQVKEYLNSQKKRVLERIELLKSGNQANVQEIQDQPDNDDSDTDQEKSKKQKVCGECHQVINDNQYEYDPVKRYFICSKCKP